MAYPLITCLVCLEDDDTFANDVDPLVDNLHRIFKASLVACGVGKISVNVTRVLFPTCAGVGRCLPAGCVGSGCAPRSGVHLF